MSKSSEINKTVFAPSFDYESILGDLSSVKFDPLSVFPQISSMIPDISSSIEVFGRLSQVPGGLEFPYIPDDFLREYRLYTSPKVPEGPELETSVLEPNSTSQGNEISISSESTDSDAINKTNEAFLGFLRARSVQFTIALKQADFEDGMMNDVADEVENYLKENKFATFLWLNSLYSHNQTDYEVISGILRIIGLTVETSSSDLLLPIVKCGLADSHSETQEAALMVIERWRTKECLDALLTTRFSSRWISKYANSIISELKEELGDAT